MTDDRRRSAATASVGAGLVAAGGHARHVGIRRSVQQSGKDYPHLHPTVLLHNPAGRRLYGAGSVAGAVGATGLAVGLHTLAHSRSRERAPGDKAGARAGATDFVREGARGTAEAVRQRGDSYRRPQASAKARLAAAAASAGAGGLGSYAARRALGSHALGRRITPAASAVAGTVAAVGSLPITNAVARRRGYEVTPTGVKRKKTALVRPTRSARVVETRAGQASSPYPRAQIVPSDRRFAKAEGDWAQRRKVYAAGATPVVGPFAAAAEAARIAPRGQGRSAFRDQLGGYYAGAASGALLGGSGAVAGAERNAKINSALNRTNEQVRATRTKLARRIGGRPGKLIAPSGPGRATRAIGRIAERPGALGRVARPFAEHPGAAVVGGYAGKVIGAGIGSYAGYSAALRRQHERDAKLNSVAKAVANGTGLTKTEQVKQIKRKRRSIGLSAAATGIGAAGVGTLAARELGPHVPAIASRVGRHKAGLERAALGSALVGGTLNSIQGVRNIQIARTDLKGQEKIVHSKALKGTLVRPASFRQSYLRRSKLGAVTRVANTVSKLDTTLSHQEAQQQVKQYGLRGPLPRNLDRPARMRAYEGRYIAAGGPKGERHQRRASEIDHITGLSIGAAGLGVGAKLAGETRPGKHLLTRIHARPGFSSRAGKFAEAAGALGAVSELAHRHERHLARRYQNTPAGVAASALTRLRAYTPDDPQEG